MGWRAVAYRICCVCVLWIVSFGELQGSPINIETDRDYVIFKLLVGRENFGDIRTICIGDSVFVSLPDVMHALGYDYEWEPEPMRFSTCCPDSKSCLTIRRDSLWRDSTYAVLPPSQLIGDDESLYLLSSGFQKHCSLRLAVFFQGFRLRVEGPVEFPKIRLRKQEEVRRNAFGRREDLLLERVDTLPMTFGRLSSVGYSLSSNLSPKGIEGTNGILSANGEFMKGSLQLNYNHAKTVVHREDDLTFKLDYGLPSKLLKQISLFRNYNTFTMDLGRYVNGVYLSNDNTTFFNQRYYLYQGRTRPNANVEIYNNEVLVAYLSADSLGRYEARIPVTSGSNNISTLTMNDYGESISDQKTIYIPLYLQPKHKFQYSVTSGYADTGKLFAGVYTAYGVTDKFTVTAMTEGILYRGEVSTISGIGLQYVPKEWLQLSINYLPGVRYTTGLTGSISRYVGYSLTYEQYRKNQTKLPYAPEMSMQLSLSGSVPLRKINNTLTFTMRQLEYRVQQQYFSSLRLNLSRGFLSGSAFVSSNSKENFLPNHLSIGGSVGCRINKLLYSDFTYNRQMSRCNNLFRERLQYRVAKRLSAIAEVQYQTQGRSLSFQLGCTFRLPSVTLAGNIRSNNNDWAMNSSVSGGISFYGKGLMHFSDQVQNGATLCVVVFADRNGNGKYDKGEKIIENPKVKVRTTAEMKQDRNGTYFRNITPNRAFRLLVPRQVFGDITWQAIPVDTAFCLAPYQSHTVYFPVKVVSEVSGEVFTVVSGKRQYLRNVLIAITPANGGSVVRTRTDDWGFYSYIGLTTGSYRITILSSGLRVKGNQRYDVVIPEADEGEQVEALDFEVEPIER